MGLRMRRMSSAELGSPDLGGRGACFSVAPALCGCPGCEVLASSLVRQLSLPAARRTVFLVCEGMGVWQHPLHAHLPLRVLQSLQACDVRVGA